MGDTFHQTAVAHKSIGVVVDDVVAVAVELRRENFLSRGHAHRVGNALAQRPSGGFDTGGITVFGMAGGFAVQLAEVFQVVDRQVVTAQVKQRVDQHGAVTIGKHKAVAVGPLGVGRVVLQVVAPQHLGNIGHAHGRTRMAGLGFLDGVHTQSANGVSEVAT